MAEFNQAPAQEQVPEPMAPAAPVQPVAAPAADDRTAQEFQKLLQNNQQLKQQVDMFQANENLRNQLAQRAQTQQQFAQQQAQPVIQQAPIVQQAQAAGIDPRDYISIDPVSGEKFVDAEKLGRKVTEAEQIARSSAQRFDNYVSNQQQREIQRMEVEAYQAYPELNPADPKFDKEFNKLTRAVIYDSVINPVDYGNKLFSFKEAADYAKGAKDQSQKTMAAQTPESNQADSKAAQAAQDLKQQSAAALPSQQPPSRMDNQAEEDLEALRIKTRNGSLDAIARRLQGSDHMKSDSDVS